MIAEFTAGEWAFLLGFVITSLAAGVVSVIVAMKSKTQVLAGVKETHDAVNSRMEKFLAEQKVETERLLKMAIEKAHAEGVRQTMEIQKATAQPGLPSTPLDVKVVNMENEPVPIKPTP